MAELVWTDVEVLFTPYGEAEVDLSDRVQSAQLMINGEALDASTMGSTWRRKKAGLKEWSVECQFVQDYAADEVDKTLNDMICVDGCSISVKPVLSDVAAETNPRYHGNVILTSYQPIGGGVGEVGTVPVTFEGTEDLTRATSD